jgi:hypothetical protein
MTERSTAMLMTKEEKRQIMDKVLDAFEAGDKEEQERLLSLLPVPPGMAMEIKETLGADALRRMNRNYSEVEAVYGPNWLDE